MPPRIKRTYAKKSPCNTITEQNEDEKENKNLQGGKNIEEKTVRVDKQTTEEFDQLFHSPLKEKLNFKPLSFWTKKLKDLESEKSMTKKNKRDLYDFSGTDDSQSPYKKNNKLKRKVRVQKKRKPDYATSNKPLKKVNRMTDKKKQTQEQFKKKIMLNKEREKLADKSGEFMFSTGMPSIGVTSTPAVNKGNLVCASNFPFLSPIIKEESSECFSFNKLQYTPLKSNANKSRKMLCSEGQTAKVETKLNIVSCKRVLRSGRVINT